MGRVALLPPAIAIMPAPPPTHAAPCPPPPPVSPRPTGLAAEGVYDSEVGGF